MQQPAQAPKYFIIRASHLILYSSSQFAFQEIKKRVLCDTPKEAIEVFYATQNSSALPNVTENYLVIEVLQVGDQLTLKKHSELTSAQVNKELWERYLKPHEHKLSPQVVQAILKNFHESPVIIRNDLRGDLQQQQLEQLYAQLKRDLAAPRATSPQRLADALPPPILRRDPPQKHAAAPSPVQRDNRSPPRFDQLFARLGKPAAHAVAAPSPLPNIPAQRDLKRDRRREEKDVADLSEMKKFLGMSDEQLNNPIAKKYFSTLHEILPNDFFQQSADHQFNWVMNNRGNQTLLPLLINNPPLACLFLDKVIAGDPQKRRALKRSRLARLYDLADIMDQREFRQRYGHLEIEVQVHKAEPILRHILERLHLQMLQRQAAPARQRQPLVVPDVKEGLRTQQIHDLHQQDKLSHTIDDNLCCMFTGRLFKDPVKLTQEIKGVSYIFHFERSQIMLWYASKKKPDGTAPNPFNNVPFKIDDLKDAPEMAEKVEAYKKSVDADLVRNAQAQPSPAPAASPSPRSPKP